MLPSLGLRKIISHKHEKFSGQTACNVSMRKRKTKEEHLSTYDETLHNESLLIKQIKSIVYYLKINEDIKIMTQHIKAQLNYNFTNSEMR